MDIGQNNLYIPFTTVAKTRGSEGTQFLGPKSISCRNLETTDRSQRFLDVVFLLLFSHFFA